MTEADVKAGMREIKLALLEADVNISVVKDFAQRVMDTWRYIFEVWLPDSPYAWNPVGLDYEFYDERCHGEPYSMEICIPLKGETSCLN